MSETEMSENLSPSEVALILGSVASAIAAIVYSMKHVKKSSCCSGCFKCQQVVVDEPCPELEPEPEQIKTETQL